MIPAFFVSVVIPVIIPVAVPVLNRNRNRNRNRNHVVNTMSLTLLFSFRVESDEPYMIPTAVTAHRSLVFDVIDLDIPKRRMAGWLYSALDSGLGDFEISDSRRIAFGKNRVRFDSHTLPYRLKFFPEYGLKKFDVNVYSGTNRVDPGTQLNATFVARHETLIRGGIIQYKLTAASAWTNLPGMAAIAQAYYWPATNALIIRNHTGEIYYCIVGTWTWITSTPANLRTIVADSSTREIFKVATSQF